MFRITTCKLVNTPININNKFMLYDRVEKIYEKQYRSLIEGLIYLTHGWILYL